MKITYLIAVCALLSSPALLGAEDAKRPTAPTASESKTYKNVGVEQFDKLRADKKNVVLDVRTPTEFAAGHIPGAMNIDWNSPDFGKKASELDNNKTYLVHCAAGGRSAKASDKLTKMNFTSVYNLEGGMRAWEKAGKPVER